MNRAKQWINALERSLFDDQPICSENERIRSGAITHFRLFELFVAAWAIAYAWTWGFYTFKSSVVVLELGVANYIPVASLFGLPSMIIAAVMTLGIAVSITRLWRWGYLVAILALHLQYVVRFSQGEIPHSSNLIGFALLALGVGFATHKDSVAQIRFTWGFLWFFVGLGYTSAAISKLVGTGITWIDGQHLVLWIHEKAIDYASMTGEWTPNVLQTAILESAWVGTLSLFIGWFTEAIGVLMWSRRLRPWVVLVTIGMHFGITWTMNIVFVAFVMQLILTGFPWVEWIVALRQRLSVSSSNSDSLTL
ncbi:MAG: hypothetical protein RI513_02430 [Balneolaceae bacterium]|nr:hypothetical protein [Balneolaceae bacterium]MDR9447041.1 hypothetical protein [Balneolaceae bacterium]